MTIATVAYPIFRYDPFNVSGFIFSLQVGKSYYFRNDETCEIDHQRLLVLSYSLVFI